MAKADRREARGRLSTIDLLPDEAEADILWANEQLRERKLPQVAILTEFNWRLDAKGIPRISKSAWGRYAVRKAIQFRRLDEAHRLFGEVADSFGPDSADKATVTVAEMIKLMLFELIEHGADPENEKRPDSKSVMEMARALSATVSAQKTSAEHRRKLEQDLLARVDKALARVGEQMAGETSSTGDASEVLKRIREDIYGIIER